MTNQPKYTISGDTLDELAISLAEAVVKSGQGEIKDTKSGNSKYAVWELDDAGSSNPFSKGISLDVATSKMLATKHGAPTTLSVSVVLRKLTPLNMLEVASRNRQAATVTEYEKLKARMEQLERKLTDPK